ncbi:hypothetical protein BACPLE_02643 [Phocaeicola plebeius DSM 17135]|uniref:Uncharacterized protein n=1 Tax=Phocaeicola plebeius (strain DSM 17135 / JCM 12973 / CCUG 54634 / M2) TaxID=484018 RepID=B5D0W6_PHOPM|nr:hypothetical protein BACPLE_02643 [Phocaeicola plebeius DSM 17135]
MGVKVVRKLYFCGSEASESDKDGCTFHVILCRMVKSPPEKCQMYTHYMENIPTFVKCEINK